MREGDIDGTTVILGDATRSRVRQGVRSVSDWKWVSRERREAELMMSLGLRRREGGVESMDKLFMD